MTVEELIKTLGFDSEENKDKADIVKKEFNSITKELNEVKGKNNELIEKDVKNKDISDKFDIIVKAYGLDLEAEDFDKMLDEAVLFINHGGQNSIVDGLIHGVPQIMIPGKVFERRYNAQSVADNEAGAAIPYQELNSSKIAAVAEQLINSSEIAENAGRLENKLVSARGVNKILREMLKM